MLTRADSRDRDEIVSQTHSHEFVVLAEHGLLLDAIQLFVLCPLILLKRVPRSALRDCHLSQQLVNALFPPVHLAFRLHSFQFMDRDGLARGISIFSCTDLP